MDYSWAKYDKGKTRKQVRDKRERDETRVVKDVRPRVAARDGYCRLQRPGILGRQLRFLFGDCRWRSTWSHYNATHRRAKTMRMAPELRHSTAGSMMLCVYHAQEYDENRILAEAQTPRLCDGPLAWRSAQGEWVEPEP